MSAPSSSPNVLTFISLSHLSKMTCPGSRVVLVAASAKRLRPSLLARLSPEERAGLMEAPHRGRPGGRA